MCTKLEIVQKVILEWPQGFQYVYPLSSSDNFWNHFLHDYQFKKNLKELRKKASNGQSLTRPVVNWLMLHMLHKLCTNILSNILSFFIFIFRYGIKKLQITCVVEDDKVSTDDLEDQITGFDDYVQSMDIVAFNKI